MPCGSGKTVIFTSIMRAALEKQKSSIMVVNGKELVRQTARRFEAEGLAVNILQGSNSINNGASITLASISTLYRRKFVPEFDLAVIDEAHLSRGDAYEWFLEKAEGKKLLGVTATPFHKKGMRHIADKIIYPVTFNELKELGFLVGGKYYASQQPDLTGIKKIGEDYDQGELSNRMNAVLNGDCIREWKSKAEGRPTIIFAVSVLHSINICRIYNEAGIATRHVDANTPDDLRTEIFGQLKSGEIQAVSNVGVLTTGVDIPEVSCLQMMRPTMSSSLWFQMLGRATRISPGKENFIVLDHSNNTVSHGMIEQESIGNLDELPKREEKAPKVNVCETCLAIFSTWPCPGCGAEKKKKETTERNIEINTDIELRELTVEGREDSIVSEILNIARQNGYKKGWCLFRLKELLGEDDGHRAYVKKIYRLDQWELRSSQHIS